MTWAALPDDDLAELAGLAARCLAADGGIPQADSPSFLRRRWAGEGTGTVAVRDPRGRLVAAGSIRPADEGFFFTGLVDPAARGLGLGSRVLDWGLAGAGRPLTVETESLTTGAEELFGSRGLRQVFAEEVMRIDLLGGVGAASSFGERSDSSRAGASQAGASQTAALAGSGSLGGALPTGGSWPAGTVLSEWSQATAGRFFAVYEAAFRERPGFPGWSAEEWIEGVAEDDDFRPQWSVLATTSAGDVGFVTVTAEWIDQVGVVPAARGAGLGAALVGEALSRMRAGGAEVAWLNVNVDNPAARLYRRLGFRVVGRRARFLLER